MGVETQKYVRKPLYVQAVRVTEQNFEEIAAWCQGDVEMEGNKRFIRVRVHHPKFPKQTQAFIGDWLLWHESGYKIYTDRAFRASFDLVEQEHIETPPTPIEEVAETAISEAEEIIERQDEIDQETERVGPDPTYGEPVSTEGKRVLTLQEQGRMSAEDVRDLVTAGEVVLEQDIAA